MTAWPGIGAWGVPSSFVSLGFERAVPRHLIISLHRRLEEFFRAWFLIDAATLGVPAIVKLNPRKLKSLWIKRRATSAGSLQD